MKLIYEPTVYLIVRPAVNIVGLPNFLVDHNVDDWTSDAPQYGDLIPEVAGRLCYMSFQNPRPGGNKAYLDRIKESGHGSVLEHANWSFIFTGVSRSLTHELVRHRAGFGFSQLSQRYVDESVAEFVVPFDLQDEVRAAEQLLSSKTFMYSAGPHDDANTLYRDIMESRAEHPGEAAVYGLAWIRSVARANKEYRDQAIYLLNKIRQQAYNTASEAGHVKLDFDTWSKLLTTTDKTELRKAARQAARSLLPNATETKIFVTANARAWRNAIEQRCSRHADTEIRVLFGKVWEVLVKEAPNLFSDYQKVSLPNGTFELVTPYRKV